MKERLNYIKTFACVSAAHQNNPRFARSTVGPYRGQVCVTNTIWTSALHQPNCHPEPISQTPPGPSLSLRLQVLPTTMARKRVPRSHGFCRSLCHDVGAGKSPGSGSESSQGIILSHDLQLQGTVS